MKKKSLITFVSCIVFLSVVGANPSKVLLPVSKIAAIYSYDQKEANIRARIFAMFSGAAVDSVSAANRLLNDSIRKILTKTKNSDSIVYFKACLNNSLKDSILLGRLSKLSFSDDRIKYNSSGILAVQCKDAATSLALDSVVMNVFSADSLMFSRVSDKNGNFQIDGINDGVYYMVFFRKAYEPFSMHNVKVTNKKQLNVDILLHKQDEWSFKISGKSIYLFIASIITVLSLILIVLAYFVIKLSGKRRNRRKAKEEEVGNVKTPHPN